MRRKIISGGSLITVLGATTVLLATVQANAGDDKALCDCADVEDTCRAIVNLQQKELIIISDTYRCAQVTWRAEDGVVAALIKGGHREMEWSGESSNPFLMVTKCSICSGRSENNGGRAIMMSGAELTNVSRSCKAASGYRSKSDKVFTDDEAGKVIAHLSAMGRESESSLGAKPSTPSLVLTDAISSSTSTRPFWVNSQTSPRSSARSSWKLTCSSSLGGASTAGGP